MRGLDTRLGDDGDPGSRAVGDEGPEGVAVRAGDDGRAPRRPRALRRSAVAAATLRPATNSGVPSDGI